MESPKKRNAHVCWRISHCQSIPVIPYWLTKPEADGQTKYRCPWSTSERWTGQIVEDELRKMPKCQAKELNNSIQATDLRSWQQQYVQMVCMRVPSAMRNATKRQKGSDGYRIGMCLTHRHKHLARQCIVRKAIMLCCRNFAPNLSPEHDWIWNTTIESHSKFKAMEMRINVRGQNYHCTWHNWLAKAVTVQGLD